MNLYDVPPADVRPLLIDERTDLLRFMRSLAPAEWAASSAAPGWSVKDLALHLLDDDLGWLSRGRDGDRTGLLSVADHGAFVEALAAKNQRWIDGAEGLSAPVIIGLLEWAGREMGAYVPSTPVPRRRLARCHGADRSELGRKLAPYVRGIHTLVAQRGRRGSAGRARGLLRRCRLALVDRRVHVAPRSAIAWLREPDRAITTRTRSPRLNTQTATPEISPVPHRRTMLVISGTSDCRSLTDNVAYVLRDPAWRVREMCAKVIARHAVGELLEAVADLWEDPVPRVRAAAIRAVDTLSRDAA